MCAALWLPVLAGLRVKSQTMRPKEVGKMIEELKPCPFCGWQADGALKTDRGLTLRHDGKGCALTDLWFQLDLWNARAAITATDPDKRLREALEEARTAIMEAARDTLWCSDKWPAETVVDHIDAALSHNGG
jgi:hypothetical protein